jgi:cytoskeletal protein RodZ
MSDVPSQEQEQDLRPDGADAEARSASVGLYLAGQRRLRGISVEELSARTRIPRRNIERLEAGAFDAAPDGFSRGFVRTVATALGLDADEAVTRLMSEPHADDSLLLSERRARFLVRVAVLGTALLVGTAGWKFVAAIASPGVERAETAVVYRRDPVRVLADRQAQVRRSEPTQIAAPLVAESD